MEISIYWVHLLVVLCLGMFMKSLCHVESTDANVYIVTLRQAPAAHYYGELRSDFTHGSPSSERLNIHKPRYFISLLLFFFSFYMCTVYSCGVIISSVQQLELIGNFDMLLKRKMLCCTPFSGC